ncbi:hypothetical protein ABZP36_028020 [Zizania latifolia]
MLGDLSPRMRVGDLFLLLTSVFCLAFFVTDNAISSLIFVLWDDTGSNLHEYRISYSWVGDALCSGAVADNGLTHNAIDFTREDAKMSCSSKKVDAAHFLDQLFCLLPVSRSSASAISNLERAAGPRKPHIMRTAAPHVAGHRWGFRQPYGCHAATVSRALLLLRLDTDPLLHPPLAYGAAEESKHPKPKGPQEHFAVEAYMPRGGFRRGECVLPR